MHIEAIYHPPTFTLTYVVSDPATKDAVVIDPVMDYDPLAVSTSDGSVQGVIDYLEREGLSLRAVLETHAHADHLSGAPALKARLGAPIAIGRQITAVQEVFKGVFNLETLKTDGSQFDVLLDDGQVYEAGSISIRAIHTPGHTPACMCYLIGDAVFTGDALFMPDFGVGRCDFPKGSAEALYHSITQKLYTLPDTTRVFVGHDYQPKGRALAYESTIALEKAGNVQLPAGRSKEEFVGFRTARDKTLSPPVLLFQSVQVNIDAGRIPPAEANGRSYIKLPFNLFG